MLELRDNHVATYTAEDAVEQLGFGCFQWKIILFCSVFSVCNSSVMCQLCHKFYLTNVK